MEEAAALAEAMVEASGAVLVALGPAASGMGPDRVAPGADLADRGGLALVAGRVVVGEALALGPFARQAAPEVP